MVLLKGATSVELCYYNKICWKNEKMEKFNQMKLEIMHAAEEKSELPARELRCYNFDQLIQSLILVVTSKGGGGGGGWGLNNFLPLYKGVNLQRVYGILQKVIKSLRKGVKDTHLTRVSALFMSISGSFIPNYTR